MKLTELPRLLSPTRWAIVGGILLLALVAIWFVMSEPGRQRQKAAEARAAGEFSQTRAGSASEAGRIADAARDAASTSEALSRENADAILSAPGAGQRLDPGLNDAGRRGLCKRAAYRGSPECVQLLGPAQPSG